MLTDITEIFEVETNVDPLIFLGNEAAIEKERRKLYEWDNYIYVVWTRSSKLEAVYYSDEPADEDDVLKSVIFPDRSIYENPDYVIGDYELEKNKGLYYLTELRELDGHEFYEFLKEYGQREYIL